MSFFGKPSGGEPRITYERIDLTAEQAVLAPSSAMAPRLEPRIAPPAAMAVVRPAPATPPALLIGAESELEGRLRSRGAVRIEGVLRGELHAASVVVAPGGLIEGLVTVEQAQIDGTVRGTVVAREIEISRTAMVEAELTYEEIGIARGARVHGLHRRREPEPAPSPAPQPEEAAPALLVTTRPAEAEALEASLTQTTALVAAAEAALQELAEVAQAAAGASAELAQEGVGGLVALEGELRDTAARLPLASPAA